MWSVAGFSALLAALATWFIGFMQPRDAFVTTTMALLMGVGGFWMADYRRRRWGLPIFVVVLVASLFVAGGMSGYSLWRVPLGITSLVFALIGGLTSPRRRDPEEAEEPGGSVDEGR